VKAGLGKQEMLREQEATVSTIFLCSPKLQQVLEAHAAFSSCYSFSIS